MGEANYRIFRENVKGFFEKNSIFLIFFESTGNNPRYIPLINTLSTFGVFIRISALFGNASGRQYNSVHDERGDHQYISRVRAQSPGQRGAQFPRQRKRAASDNRGRDELRPSPETEKPPQYRNCKSSRVHGEREQQRADDVGEHKSEQQRHDTVHEDHDARTRDALRALLHAEQPADDDGAAEERRVGAAQHDAQQGECEQGNQSGRQYFVCNGGDARTGHVAEPRAVYSEEADDERDRDERAGRVRDALLRRGHVLRAEHAAEDVGARRVRGAVREHQQEQVERREVRVERERRRGSAAQRGARETVRAAEQREARHDQQPRDNQAGLEKVRAQDGKLPARERVAREHGRRRDSRRRVAQRGERHQELGRSDDLCRHDARPRDRNHHRRHQARALPVQVLHQVRERVLPVTVRAARERNQRDKPERPHEHEPAGGTAEPRAGIHGTDDGRPAENRRDETPRHRPRRRALARHKKVGNALHAAGATHGDNDQENEIDNQSNSHKEKPRLTNTKILKQVRLHLRKVQITRNDQFKYTQFFFKNRGYPPPSPKKTIDYQGGVT